MSKIIPSHGRFMAARVYHLTIFLVITRFPPNNPRNVRKSDIEFAPRCPFSNFASFCSSTVTVGLLVRSYSPPISGSDLTSKVIDWEGKPVASNWDWHMAHSPKRHHITDISLAQTQCPLHLQSFSCLLKFFPVLWINMFELVSNVQNRRSPPGVQTLRHDVVMAKPHTTV